MLIKCYVPVKLQFTAERQTTVVGGGGGWEEAATKSNCNCIACPTVVIICTRNYNNCSESKLLLLSCLLFEKSTWLQLIYSRVYQSDLERQQKLQQIQQGASQLQQRAATTFVDVSLSRTYVSRLKVQSAFRVANCVFSFSYNLLLLLLFFAVFYPSRRRSLP